MDITVKLPEEERIITLPEGSNSFILLKNLGLYPDAVLLFRNDSFLTEDEEIHDGERIEIMKIASGG